MAALKWSHSTQTSCCTQEATFVTGPVRQAEGCSFRAGTNSPWWADCPFGSDNGTENNIKVRKGRNEKFCQDWGCPAGLVTLPWRGSGHHFPASKLPVFICSILTFHCIFIDHRWKALTTMAYTRHGRDEHRNCPGYDHTSHHTEDHCLSRVSEATKAFHQGFVYSATACFALASEVSVLLIIAVSFFKPGEHFNKMLNCATDLVIFILDCLRLKPIQHHLLVVGSYLWRSEMK